MEMVKVKVSELTGTALDWAVAKGIELDVIIKNGYVMAKRTKGERRFVFNPSVHWAHGGPLIQEYEMSINRNDMEVYAHICDYGYGAVGRPVAGQTELIAACRAFVTWKLGARIEVPAVLVEVGE